ncbi:exocyst complex component EXO84B-like [Chlorella sorokiniana]|uniref:Exocyst complex component EXO84B-like n=1 Tax=Chlorella sorokiniana TaxID=3076 RepID=A0A2P6THV1_CHLSO|nr:exocyst complex component EXO84B-like [Chlorella sorokiniana]|eukprot:PRW33875.1 exocyst complex component EXO84B-like [Chlorella sorokiniana]
MQQGRQSPLTPAASWAPQGSGDEESTAVQRSKSSTLARLTRTVSKLGSSRGSKARQAAAAAAAGEAGTSAAGPRRVSSTEALQRATTMPGHHRMGSGGGFAPAGSRVQDAAAATAARIRQFEEGRFDLQRDLGSLTEKGVERLRGELAALDGEVGSQLKAAVHEHYQEFVNATPGVLRLEGEIQQLRTLLHNMGDVVSGLKEVSAAVAQSQRAAAAAPSQQQAGAAAADAEAAWRQTGDGAKWLECLDDADVAVAERRVSDALALLRRLEKLLQRFVAAADAADPAHQERLDALGGEMEARRERLMRIAEQQVLQPIATAADICTGAELLGRIAGRQYAHSVVLEAHAAKLRRRQAVLLRPANSGGGDSDGSDYAAALGQKLALGLAAAADDCSTVWGQQGAPELAAAFLVWALHQTERACHLLRKHALLPFAAPAGLAAFTRCAFAFAAHCAALEASHGLQLLPTVLRELWPPMEQVLARRLRKLGEALRRAVITEVERLAAGEADPPADPSSWECLAQAFPSADYFLDELEATAVEARRLAYPRLASALRRGTTDLFQLYSASLAAALNRALKAPGLSEEGRDRLAAAAEGAMELATLLVERCLPEALQSLADLFGEVCDARALGDQLMRMGEALGFTTVPLTPGGSVAVEVDDAAAGAAVAGQQQSEDERRAAEEEEQAALDAAAGRVGQEGGSEISELSSFRTTSDE